MADENITLFESGVGTGDDLLLGFPDSATLESEGIESFYINHKVKGYDGSKIIPYRPLKNFLYMVKADYYVRELSKVGLIDFKVDMLKPHNYKFILKASVTTEDGIVYTYEKTLEGTTSRSATDYTIVEFDSSQFVPETIDGIAYEGSMAEVIYQITDMTTGNFNIVFEDGTRSTKGWKNIKAKVLDRAYFRQLLLEEIDTVANPIIATRFFNRDEINATLLPMTIYPNQESNMSMNYSVDDTLSGRLVEYGIKGKVAKGMDFPYLVNLTLDNPYCNTISFSEEYYYLNFDAGDSEIINTFVLADYFNQTYDPTVHGESYIRNYEQLVNTDDDLIILDPRYINPLVDFYELSTDNNTLNFNNISHLKTEGLSPLDLFDEKEILFETIYNEKIFRVFKSRNRTNKSLNTYNTRLHYEVLNISETKAIATMLIAEITDSTSIESDEKGNAICRTSSDIYVEKANFFIHGSSVYIVPELIKSYIYKVENGSIENTPFYYELMQIKIDMDSNLIDYKSIKKIDYNETMDIYEAAKALYAGNGEEKLIISPSCKADLYKGDEKDRLDILYKEIIAKKSTYTGSSMPGVLDEKHTIHYITEETTPVVIYDGEVPLLLDSGDTIGIASIKNQIIAYGKLWDEEDIANGEYVGKFFNIETAQVFNIDFAYKGLIKVIGYNNAFLMFRLKGTLMSAVRINYDITEDIVLDDVTISVKGRIPILNKDIVNNHIFKSNTSQTFKSWYDIEELINTIDLATASGSVIYKDRYSLSYINDNGYVGDQVQGDFIDFMLRINTSQMQVLENKIIWYGVANTVDNYGHPAIYTFQTEMDVTGFDSITNLIQVYNNARLTTTQLFETAYENAEGKQLNQTGEAIEANADVMMYSFVSGDNVVMFDKIKDTLFIWDKNLEQEDRTDYITEMKATELTLTLPEPGFLIAINVDTENAFVLLEKTPTEIMKLVDGKGSEKVIPVKSRYIGTTYKFKIYNYDSIDRILARYSLNMPYEDGDIVEYELSKYKVDFRGSNITKNRGYAYFEVEQKVYNGAESLVVKAIKTKDMDYELNLKEQFIDFTYGVKEFISEEMLPLLSFNGTAFGQPVEDSSYEILYIKDYINGDDYGTSLSYLINQNCFECRNPLPDMEYALTFAGSFTKLVSVNKRDVFDKYINQNELPAPNYKKLIYKGTKFFNFVVINDNYNVEVKTALGKVYYYTNYQEIGEETPKELRVEKTGGHTNSYVYWQSNPGASVIAKTQGENILTKTDQTLCILAAEEEIVLKSEAYTNWFTGSVNGTDDKGIEVDPILLADETYVLNNLSGKGIRTLEVPLIASGILGLIPEVTETEPIYSVILDVESIDYTILKDSEDVGLDHTETRDSSATIRFSSDYETTINLANPAYTDQMKLGLLAISASQMNARYLVPIANPLKSKFYYEDGTIAFNVTMFIPDIEATSENILLSIDYETTIKVIDSNKDISNMTNQEKWEYIVSNSITDKIQLYVKATIAFVDQIAWNPNINIGTYYLNDHEMTLLPDSNDIVIVASDFVTFETSPIPEANSPIVLINKTSGTVYEQVFFLDDENNYSIYNTETIKFTDGNTGVLSFENVDKDSIKMDIDLTIDFTSGNLIKLNGAVDPNAEVKVTYCIVNSFAANVYESKNTIKFDIHCNEENAKFSVNYTTDKTMVGDVNANPLTSVSRGFIQI